MGDLSLLSSETPVDLEALRTRLRNMPDNELRRFGRAALCMCAAKANIGKPRREAFVIQLEEARVEWQRRIIERTEKRPVKTKPVWPKSEPRA